jgi:ferrous iron transport protein B
LQLSLIILHKNIKNIVLTGNPNSGKSSLFNALTGLNQKVGNFPGVTVDKKMGEFSLSQGKIKVYDLPGTYSLYPRRADEWVAYKVLMGLDEEVQPDVVVVAVDASNLKRNLLFCTQIIDLQIPVVVALTMTDIAAAKGIKFDIDKLQQHLQVPVIAVNPRGNKGLPQLKKAIEERISNPTPQNIFYEAHLLAPKAIEEIKPIIKVNSYKAIHYLIHHEDFGLNKNINEQIELAKNNYKFNATQTQAQEVIARYQSISKVMQTTVQEPSPLAKKIFTDKLDNILLHRFWGYFILVFVLFILFQSVFWFAQFPMDGIEWSFNEASNFLQTFLPDSKLTSLLLNGVLAGLSGILVFVPQIMILFGLISVLEDTGYMARISFLSDKLMRKVGLNGKSVMPMISGFACAVPAIMAARNIENKKERLLTILITPFMSCSARLPVFTILISLVIPNTYYFGFLGLQALVMMGLYVFGIFIAMVTSLVAKRFLSIKEKSFFILELPVYRNPRWKNVVITMIEKAKIFLFDAGKIIMIISIALWLLSSYGPGNKLAEIESKYQVLIEKNIVKKDSLQKLQSAEMLQYSYAGKIGQAIEPVIKPLGYDWKIGIALITSFAAREVFVGTMATLYSVEEDNANSLKEKLQAAKHRDGRKVYTLATCLSLMMFYLLAMQCMSTLAIVKRETRSWKFPLIQLLLMTGLAYGLSYITYFLFA